MDITENSSNVEFCNDLPDSDDKKINIDNQTDNSTNDIFSNKSTIDSDMKLSMSSYNSELDDGQEVPHQDDDSSSDGIFSPVETDEPKELTDDFSGCSATAYLDKINLAGETIESTDSKVEDQLEQKTNDTVIEVDKEKSLSITEDKTKVNKKIVFQKSPESICDICSKTVYPMEKLLMDSKCYHKSCFKCCKCGKALNPAVVSKFNNNLFCKPHYISLFRKRGRYDDINVNTEETSVTGSGSTVTSTNNFKEGEPNKVDQKGADSCKADGLGSGDLPRTASDSSKQKEFEIGNEGNRVAGATRAWSEARALGANDWKKNNCNNNSEPSELQSSSASVSSLKARFESSQ